MRLIEDPAALDASINVYMKVKALGHTRKAAPRASPSLPATWALQQARSACPECERPYRGSHSGVRRDCRAADASVRRLVHGRVMAKDRQQPFLG